MLMLDKGWGTVKYANRDSLIAGVLTYGGYGYKNNTFSNPTGIAIGRYFTTTSTTVYPVYISDQNNHRLVRVYYQIGSDGSGSFLESSFKVLDSTAGGTSDVAFFQCMNQGDKNDKIWTGGIYNNYPTITCYDTNGTVMQRFSAYRNFNGGEDLHLLAGSDVRMATYSSAFNCLEFVDNIRNCVVPCPLDTNGLGTLYSIGNGQYSIYSATLLQMPEGQYVNSVRFQKTSAQTLQWPYTWVTTGFTNKNPGASSMVHLFKVNSYCHWQYMGSADQPRNSSYSYSNLMNVMLVSDYYDIFTMENWNTNTYGLRRYVPFIDIRNDVVSNYCAADSMDDLQWQATFTNECWVKISVQRKNGNSWDNVDIKSIDYTNYPVGTKEATIFRYAGWTEDHPIKIKLRLPLKDYVFGDSLKMLAIIYPEYLDTLVGNQYLERYYPVFVKKTCMPVAGGCPFLYVTDANGNYTPDNNILDKSEYSSGDITDKYKLTIPPQTTNNIIDLAILENENDNSYINMFKIYAVDYPSNRKMGVTDGNVIVIYDSATVTASDTVLKNITNITNDVNYFTPSATPTNGTKTDSLYAHFKNTSLSPMQKIQNDVSKKAINKNKSDRENSDVKAQSKGYGPNGPAPNWAFISDLGNLVQPNPSAKDTGGVLIANSIYSNIVTKMFARRERNSVVILPLFGDSNKVNNFKIKWQDDYRMKYLGIANVEYTGFNVNEIPLNKAYYTTSTLDSGINSAITTVDSSYGLVSSTGLIRMTFDLTNVPSIPSHWVRGFVIEVNGHYTAGSDNPSLANVHEQVPLVFKLSQNYPNPFNPTTKINYDLPKDSRVKLIIYDILGREVERLVDNDLKQAGHYVIYFDGTNLASGVYFYHIEAGTFIESKKMVLVK